MSWWLWLAVIRWFTWQVELTRGLYTLLSWLTWRMMPFAVVPWVNRLNRCIILLTMRVIDWNLLLCDARLTVIDRLDDAVYAGPVGRDILIRFYGPLAEEAPR